MASNLIIYTLEYVLLGIVIFAPTVLVKKSVDIFGLSQEWAFLLIIIAAGVVCELAGFILFHRLQGYWTKSIWSNLPKSKNVPPEYLEIESDNVSVERLVAASLSGSSGHFSQDMVRARDIMKFMRGLTVAFPAGALVACIMGTEGCWVLIYAIVGIASLLSFRGWIKRLLESSIIVLLHHTHEAQKKN